MSNAISNFDEPQFLLPDIPNASSHNVCSSVKSNGSSDSGAETSDSCDDKSNGDYLKCSYCRYITNELSFYIYHLKKIHYIESVQCFNCKVILNIDNYQKHFIKCKGSYTCEHCTASFAQKSYLQRHISRVHSKSNVKYSCDICGQILSSNNNLKQHKLIHLDTNQFVCEFCNKGFVQKIHYNTHLDIHHSKRELVNVEKPYICCVCGEQFIFQTTLQIHMNQYCCKKEKKYVCETCSKSFLYPSELRRHKTVHQDKNTKLYSCHLCDKKYNRLYQFIEHLFFHENINSAFKCPKCDKILSDLLVLKKHYRRHFLNKNNFLIDAPNTNYKIDNNHNEDELMDFSDCCNERMDVDMKEDDAILIDNFIDEMWDKFEPYKDDEHLQDISFNDLKYDVWEEFNI